MADDTGAVLERNVDRADEKLGPLASALVVLVFLGLLGGLLYLGIRPYWAKGWDGTLSLVGGAYLQLLVVILIAAGYLLLTAIFLSAGLLLSGSKLRRVRVFISFQHAYEGIAETLGELVSRSYIEVVRLPFDATRPHDFVIRESLEAVTRSDLVLVVPGPTASWSANELGHAVGSKKPIVVIKHLADQRLSDSLYENYPTFEWEKVRKANGDPLVRYIAFAANSWVDIKLTYLRVLSAFLGKAFRFMFGNYTAIWVARGLLDLTSWIDLDLRYTLEVGLLWIYLSVFVAGFGALLAQTLARRLRCRRVARQLLLFQLPAREELSVLFEELDDDKAVLDALVPEPLPIAHR